MHWAEIVMASLILSDKPMYASDITKDVTSINITSSYASVHAALTSLESKGMVIKLANKSYKASAKGIKTYAKALDETLVS